MKCLKNSFNKFAKNYKKNCTNTILIGKRTNVIAENDDIKYIKAEKTKFAQITKLKMKWKTMQWMLDNKKSIIKLYIIKF